jgi:hypothetical protein
MPEAGIETPITRFASSAKGGWFEEAEKNVVITDLWYLGQTAALFDAARRGCAQHGAANFPARYCEKPAVQQPRCGAAGQGGHGLMTFRSSDAR